MIDFPDDDASREPGGPPPSAYGTPANRPLMTTDARGTNGEKWVGNGHPSVLCHASGLTDLHGDALLDERNPTTGLAVIHVSPRGFHVAD